MARILAQAIPRISAASMLLAAALSVTGSTAWALDDSVDCNIPFDDYCTYGGPYDEPPDYDPNDPGPIPEETEFAEV